MSISLSTAARRVVIFVMALCLAGRCAATAIVEFPEPTPGGEPEGITLGPDGAVWFVESQASKIGRMDTNGVPTEFTIPGPLCFPIGIVVGPDSSLWFTEFKRSKIGRIDTNGVITEYSLPPNIFSVGLTFGPDRRLWVVDYGAPLYIPGTPTNGGILALTIDLVGTNGVLATNYYNSLNSSFTSNSRPEFITSGPDGKLYFTENVAGKIGRITTNGIITETNVATNSLPYAIVTGPDGALWFTEGASNSVGRLDTNLNLTEYLLPTNVFGPAFNEPYGLVVGPDGNLWYSDARACAIGRIVLSGTNVNPGLYATNVTQYFTPTTNSSPTMLAVGADHNLWFGEFSSYLNPGLPDNIARFTFPAPLTIMLTNSQVVISWTTNLGTNFALESNPDLTTTNWTFVTNVPGTNGNVFTVTNPASNGNLFYRLID